MMKRIISSFLLLSMLVLAQNPYINKSNILDDVINSLDAYTNYREKIGFLREINDKTWINSNWIYTYRINLEKNIGIFRIEKVFTESGKKYLGDYTFESGTVFYYDGNYNTFPEKVVFLDKESKLGVKTCLINSSYSKEMLISNPTCKEKWQNEVYLHNVNKIFQPKTMLIRKQMESIVETKDTIDLYTLAIKEFIANSTAIITAFKKEGAEVEVMKEYFYTRILDITIFLLHKGEIYNKNSIKAIWIEGLSKTVADAIATAITSGTNPLDGIVVALNKSTDIVDITTNLWGAFDVDSLTEEINELLVARLYLELFYKYGGKHLDGTDANGDVAQYYGGSQDSSLEEAIWLVAEKGDYKLENNWWGTEYKIPSIIQTVEDIKNNFIPRTVNTCLTDGCLDYYLKID